jgi:pyruvate ferredoxin oxidoreductase gamma subunit
MIEIRWHGRGGQGAMVAARTLASAAINAGKYAQGMPEFGPERMGAPIRAYNRISEEPLYLYCAVVNPDVVLVLDVGLLSSIDVTEGIAKDGCVILNSALPPNELRPLLKTKTRIYTIDASGISTEILGRNLPNTVMLGALINVAKSIPLEVLLRDVRETFSEKFPEKVVNANIIALKRGFEEVKAG